MASASKSKDKAVGKTLGELGLQVGEEIEIDRRELKGAPYNPRVMGATEKRKLKAGLKRHGLIGAAIIWNRRTGNIVGGHQRVDQLDSLAGTADYKIRITAIDVDETRERELNIILNNQSAQGGWDFEKLGDLLRTDGLDLSGAGFDHADVFKMFGSSLSQTEDPLDELAAKVNAAREKMNNLAREESSETEFYMVVVFRNGLQLTEFLKVAGLPDDRYQSGEEIMRLCGVNAE